MTSQRPAIVIEVLGGVVTFVRANAAAEEVSVLVVDWDEFNDGDAGHQTRMMETGVIVGTRRIDDGYYLGGVVDESKFPICLY
jgi:hypothetical protein